MRLCYCRDELADAKTPFPLSSMLNLRNLDRVNQGSKLPSTMATSALRYLLLLFLFSYIFFSSISPSSSSSSSAFPEALTLTPTPWPLQFHALLYVNYSGDLSMIDLWYDWPNGRNFNIITYQLGRRVYDLEWNNGTSFVYTLPPRDVPTCSTAQLDVGILRPDWLDGANYLGRETVEGFLCDVWEKVEFIWYYEDVETKRPVHWVFYTGRSIHVMTFEVGAVLDDPNWQAPIYCFDKEKEESPKIQIASSKAFPENYLTRSKVAEKTD